METTPTDASSAQIPVTKYRLDSDRATIVRTTPPVVMDMKGASAYMDCSPRKLRVLIASPRVKHTRIGAKIAIRREWLDAFQGKYDPTWTFELGLVFLTLRSD